MDHNARMKIYTVVFVYLDDRTHQLRVYSTAVDAYSPGRALDIAKRGMMAWSNSAGEALRKQPERFDDEFMVFEGEYTLSIEPA